MSLKKGEIAYVTIPPEHAFNRVESKQDLAVVPPNSTVHYEIELVSFVKVGWCSLASSPSTVSYWTCHPKLIELLSCTFRKKNHGT